MFALLWLAYLPFGVKSLHDYLSSRRRFLFGGVAAPPPGVHITFEVVSLSASRAEAAIRSTLASVRASCAALGFSDYSLMLVTDDPADRELGLDADSLVVVPADYSAHAIRKARSLQYALETGVQAGPDRWLFHLDEESNILPQTLRGLFSFIASGKGVMAEGPIFYPHMEGASPLMRLTESIRASGCYECAHMLLKGGEPTHLHGSGLLVRSDAEKEVGWDNGKTVAEDQLFGYELWKKYPGQVGWHGGLILESPPLTVHAHQQQRRRWFGGTLENLHRTGQGWTVRYRLGLWIAGFFATLVALPLWGVTAVYLPLKLLGAPVQEFGYAPFLTGGQVIFDIFDGRILHYVDAGKFMAVGMGSALALSFGLWLFNYLHGFYLNRVYSTDSPRTLVKDWAVLLLSIPLVGIVENFPAVRGFADWVRHTPVEWVVTPKGRPHA
jgi:egghead protein (zeste-white 4 protein)